MVRDGTGGVHRAGGGAAGRGGFEEEDGTRCSELDIDGRYGGGHGAGRGQVRDNAPRADPRARPTYPRPTPVLPFHHPRP